MNSTKEAIALDDPRPLLVQHARSFYERGWMWGTAGNLSAHMPDGSFWITASGCAKGELDVHQFVQLSLDGALLSQPQPEAKPSAESSIHQAIYKCIPGTGACYHVHSIAATLVSCLTNDEAICLPPLEMVKGLGIWDQNPKVALALFANHPHVPQIAADIVARFTQNVPQLPACLIRNHGVTVWGRSPTEARNRIEAIEFIFQTMIQAQHLNLDLNVYQTDNNF